MSGASTITAVSKEWLLGLTVGAYVTAAALFTMFGRVLFVPNHLPTWRTPSRLDVEPSGLLLLVPAAFVGLLSFLQIKQETLFEHKGDESVTWTALWLNTIGSVGLCLAIPTVSLLQEFPPQGLLNVIALGIRCLVGLMFVAVPIGAVASILNLVWTFFGLYGRASK